MQVFEGTLVLKSTETVARDMKKFRFKKPDGFEFIAGQFLSIQFTETAWRAYSIASAPHEKFIELVIRLIPGGLGSTVLGKTKVGDEFFFRGAFGNLMLSKNPNANLVFCATGAGISPMRSMILTEAKSHTPRAMKLFYGCRNMDDTPYLDEIGKWGPKDLKIYLGLSREKSISPLSLGEGSGVRVQNCRITKFLEEKNFDKKAEFYICGNGDMVMGVTDLLQKKGIPKDQIFMERFN